LNERRGLARLTSKDVRASVKCWTTTACGLLKLLRPGDPFGFKLDGVGAGETI
jgi:hypothetical protein